MALTSSRVGTFRPVAISTSDTSSSLGDLRSIQTALCRSPCSDLGKTVIMRNRPALVQAPTVARNGRPRRAVLERLFRLMGRPGFSFLLE